MGYAEIRRTVNSDFTEPLNFNNYINDISSFGSESYVLASANQNLWRDLISHSPTLFGHKAIHSLVYKRLTTQDINYMLLYNFNLGRCLNNFYNTNVFDVGDIDDVLSHITVTSYNMLEEKIRKGINSYIDQKTKDKTVGKWLYKLFNVERLQSMTSMNEVLSDATLWINDVSTNESLKFIICNSVAAITFASGSSSTINDTIYKQFIETVSKSTLSTSCLILQLAGRDKLNEFFNNDTVLNNIFANSESLKAVLFSNVGLSAMIKSTKALNKLVNDSNALSTILKTADQVVKTQKSIDAVISSTNTINSNIGNISAIDPILDPKFAYQNLKEQLSSLKSCVSTMNMILKNISVIYGDKTTMTTIANNETAMNMIANDAGLMEAVSKSPNSLNCICKVDSARRIWQNSPYAQDYYNNIVASLADTKYFTKKYQSITGPVSDSGFFYNAANPTGIGTESPSINKSKFVPDACIIAIGKISAYSTAYTGEAYNITYRSKYVYDADKPLFGKAIFNAVPGYSYNAMKTFMGCVTAFNASVLKTDTGTGIYLPV